jgi:putative SOS response-associated peptidase YedK
MCRRYKINPNDIAELRRYEGFDVILRIPSIVSLGSTAPALVMEDGKIHFRLKMFGFQGYHDPILNARTETVLERPTFAESFQSRRCLLPASGFYEEDRYHNEHYFYSPSGMIYLGGIYQDSRFVLLTRTPNDNVAFYHPRMPLALAEKDFPVFLNTQKGIQDLLSLEGPEIRTDDTSDQLSLF